MAYTIVKSSSNTVTITAGISPVSLRIARIEANGVITDLLEVQEIPISGSYVLYYTVDMLGVFYVTESGGTLKYVDLCTHYLMAHLKLDVIDLLLYPVVVCDYSSKKYDFVSLVLLGLTLFGNTTYVVALDNTITTVAPLALQKVSSAIMRCNKYIGLNASTTQSTN
jgi:hypothetical protein